MLYASDVECRGEGQIYLSTPYIYFMHYYLHFLLRIMIEHVLILHSSIYINSYSKPYHHKIYIVQPKPKYTSRGNHSCVLCYWF